MLAHIIKHSEGNAAASNKSCAAYEYAFVANVSKLKGRSINVIGSSFIISSAINTPTNKIFVLR